MLELTSDIGYDCTFELNEFNEQKLCSEVYKIKNVLMFILFTKPGDYPSMPEIGIDISSYLYEFYDEFDPAEFQQRLVEQCAALGTYINSGQINIRKTMYKNQPSLMISITGTESYPANYKCRKNNSTKNILIGITYDELKKMVYNISTMN